MWFGSDSPKCRIEEANRHLSALTQKVTELEDRLLEKEAELKKKEEDFVTTMEETHHRRELEVRDLNALIYKQNVSIRDYERDTSKKDSELTVLRKRCRMLDEMLRYKATLGKLTITMEQAEQYASMTSNARGYVTTKMNGMNEDLINTEPAPLMLRGVELDTDANSLPMLPADPTYADPKRGSLLKLSGN